MLRGPERLWRLRVGDWRVIFDRHDADRVIDVLVIGPRGRAYRR
ncbi:MAG: type II toxin-antitoxin system RelE family toxin [Solirubrobacteraceae bacterium]